MTDAHMTPDPRRTQSTTQEVAKKTRAAAADAAYAAKNEAMAQADAVKSSLAGEVDTVASALRDASGDLTAGSPQMRATSQAADTLDSLSKTIRDADLGAFVSSTTRFARRNPVAFLGSAALLGFAAARFAKATADDFDDDRAAYHHASRAGSGVQGGGAPGTGPVVAPTPQGTRDHMAGRAYVGMTPEEASR